MGVGYQSARQPPKGKYLKSFNKEPTWAREFEEVFGENALKQEIRKREREFYWKWNSPF